MVLPHDRRLPARKLWIAFAVGSRGTVVVDDGARRALRRAAARRCCRPASSRVEGTFDADDAVEIAGPDGVVFAKGLVRARRRPRSRRVAGRRTADLPDGVAHEVVHRDDLVVLP